MERDKSEMLKYQEKLKGSSGSFQIPETVSAVTTPRKRAMSFSEEHEEAMKQAWFDKVERSRQRRLSVSSESLTQIATISSEKKRVFRRRASMSLLDLQRANEGINGKSRAWEVSKTFLNPLEEEPSTDDRRFLLKTTKSRYIFRHPFAFHRFIKYNQPSFPRGILKNL